MLILGKQYTKSNPNKIGGVIMLFELFKKELKKENVDFDVIDLNWRNYSHWLFAYPVIIFLILVKIPKHHYVSLHGTANEFIYIGPLLVWYAKLLKKKISLRKFAGNFDDVYKLSNKIQKKLISYTLENANVVFFETHYLVEYFKKFNNNNTHWFPNVRERSLYRTSLDYKRKFVFIGHVISTKGIVEIMNTFKMLNEKYTIDIFGPLSNTYDETMLNTDNVTYKGVLKPDDITSTLQNYDVLVLPSHREGYPGVILEAFSVGLPVIATNLKGIQEIVTDDCGILIDRESVDQLKMATEAYTVENYNQYSQNALKRFKSFDSSVQTKKILHLIKDQIEL